MSSTFWGFVLLYLFEFIYYHDIGYIWLTNIKKQLIVHTTPADDIKFHYDVIIVYCRLLLGDVEGELSSDPNSMACILQRLGPDGGVVKVLPRCQVQMTISLDRPYYWMLGMYTSKHQSNLKFTKKHLKGSGLSPKAQYNAFHERSHLTKQHNVIFMIKCEKCNTGLCTDVLKCQV